LAGGKKRRREEERGGEEENGEERRRYPIENHRDIKVIHPNFFSKETRDLSIAYQKEHQMLRRSTLGSRKGGRVVNAAERKEQTTTVQYATATSDQTSCTHLLPKLPGRKLCLPRARTAAQVRLAPG
jgi:hypothetical protein